MKLTTKKINNQTKDLKYGTEGAACFDIPANADVEWKIVKTSHYGVDNRVAQQSVLCFEAVIPTGYQFQIPEGFKMSIYPRSGWGFKYNIQLANGTGIIDYGYIGEVQVKLIAFCNRNKLPDIKRGDRIAQAEITPVINVDFDYVEEDAILSTDSDRGISGFGSTGVQ